MFFGKHAYLVKRGMYVPSETNIPRNKRYICSSFGNKHTSKQEVCMFLGKHTRGMYVPSETNTPRNKRYVCSSEIYIPRKLGVCMFVWVRSHTYLKN